MTCTCRPLLFGIGAESVACQSMFDIGAMDGQAFG